MLFALLKLGESGSISDRYGPRRSFIDAIAGGGGLIALPAMSVITGPGVEAIGTNKITSLAAAGIAFA